MPKSDIRQWIVVGVTLVLSALTMAYSVGIQANQISRNSRDIQYITGKFVPNDLLSAKLDGVESQLADIKSQLQQQHQDLQELSKVMRSNKR